MIQVCWRREASKTRRIWFSKNPTLVVSDVTRNSAAHAHFLVQHFVGPSFVICQAAWAPVRNCQSIIFSSWTKLSSSVCHVISTIFTFTIAFVTRAYSRKCAWILYTNIPTQRWIPIYAQLWLCIPTKPCGRTIDKGKTIDTMATPSTGNLNDGGDHKFSSGLLGATDLLTKCMTKMRIKYLRGLYPFLFFLSTYITVP